MIKPFDVMTETFATSFWDYAFGSYRWYRKWTGGRWYFGSTRTWFRIVPKVILIEDYTNG